MGGYDMTTAETGKSSCGSRHRGCAATSAGGHLKLRKGGFLCHVRQEMSAIMDRDPAIRTSYEVFLYPSFRALLYYRMAHKLWISKHYFLARAISQHAANQTGIEIHPGAVIGKALFIDHGAGVVIGETTVIGDYVTLYQGVTLGGTGKDKGKRHPTIGNNVMIGAGAKVLGPIVIHDNCRIGAGSVVLRDVPEDCTVVGVPGRIVRMNDRRIPRSDMDQVNLPDPVLEDISKLRRDIEKLKKSGNRTKKAEEDRAETFED